MELFQRFMWPELRALPPYLRRKVIEHWQYRHGMSRRTLFELIILALAWIALLIVGVSVFLHDDTPRRLSLLPGVLWRIMELALWAVALGLTLRAISRVLRREFQAYLRATWKNGRPPICYGCGYDLRGSPGLACPECGEAIPHLNLPD